MTEPRTMTGTYGQIHQALQEAATHHPGLTAADVRVLVAIHEHGGEILSHPLANAAVIVDTQVRRSSLTLRALGLIRADSGPGTTRPRRGTQARFTTTPAGRDLAARALTAANWPA
jgi:hypothetical protein